LLTILEYRKEIDGLRAIAVIVVMLFHAGFQFISGGFLGVDIFFVISGYLITSIIFIEKSKDDFSLWNFYERRVRRLMPALFIMMIICIPFAVLMMQPDDLQNFGQSLISTSLISNNILLFITSGYWDLSSEFKPLLHTWSLGVEEQYYIFFPLLVFFIWKFSYMQTIHLFLLISLLSLAFSFSIQGQYPEADFYLLPSRIWELGLGGALALCFLLSQEYFTSVKYYYKQAFSLLGLFLVVAPIFFFDDLRLINFNRLSVVIGTLLIISFGHRDTYVGSFLSLRFLVFIGLISYSLYLWHQPLYVFLRIYSLSEPSNLMYLTMFLLSFPIAFLSFKIEKFYRDKTIINLKMLTLSMIMALSVCIISGLVFTQTYGFYRTYPELSSKYSIEYEPNIINPDTSFLISATDGFKDNFDYTSNQKKKIIIAGDSFSSDFINMGKVNNLFNGFDVVKLKYNCFNFNDLAANANELLLRSDFVVLTYRFLKDGPQKKCLENKIKFLLDSKKLFVIIGPKDFGYNINAPLRRKLYSYKATPSSHIVNFNSFTKNLVPKKNYIDFLELLGDDAGLIPIFTPDQKLISYDRAHLTYNGAINIGQQLFAHQNLLFFQDP